MNIQYKYHQTKVDKNIKLQYRGNKKPLKLTLIFNFFEYQTM